MRVRATLFAAIAALSLPVGVARSEGPGSDAFGNRITSSKFDASIPTGLFHDISGTGALLVNFRDDAIEFDVSLGGFKFPFYGQTYDKLAFSTNGFISTGPRSSGRPEIPANFRIPGAAGRGAAHIFVYHDDLRTAVYGQYFDQASSPIGTETYIAQWEGCVLERMCKPTDIAELRFNAMLLRDGTIIMAYDTVGPDFRAGATIGIQNDDATDGIEYSYNEDVITDGMTIIVYSPASALLFGPPRPFVGLGKDANILVAQLASMQARAGASAVRDAIRSALFEDWSGDLMSVASSTTEMADGPRANLPPLWVSVSGAGVDGWAGASMHGRSTSIHGGIEHVFVPGMVGGVALGYGSADLAIGALSANQRIVSVQPYVGMRLGEHGLFTGSFTYSQSQYDFAMPLGAYEAAGHRFEGAASVSAPVDLSNGFSLTPELSVRGGVENVSDLVNGGNISIPVDQVGFLSVEGTVKLEKSFQLESGAGSVYALGGLEHVRTTGDDTIALFASSYSNNALGGVLGAGLSYEGFNGFSASAHIAGRGLGTQSTSFDIGGQLKFAF